MNALTELSCTPHGSAEQIGEALLRPEAGQEAPVGAHLAAVPDPRAVGPLHPDSVRPEPVQGSALTTDYAREWG